MHFQVFASDLFEFSQLVVLLDRRALSEHVRAIVDYARIEYAILPADGEQTIE